MDGGARRDRTDDLMLAKHALYQLSYGPSFKRPAKLGASLAGVAFRSSSVRPRVTQSVVGPGGLEPPTSRLSGVCSNQLSYRPLKRSAQTPGQLPQWTMAWRLNARSHHSLHFAAAVFEERETKTAASRTCVVLMNASIDRETVWRSILRKEVIQPQVPLRLPCYDFTPVADPTVVGCLHCWLAHRLRVKPTPMV